MSADLPLPPSTWWSYYTDATGNRVTLDITVEGSQLLVTTATGEVLGMTPTELAMLMENLQSAADYQMKHAMRRVTGSRDSGTSAPPSAPTE
ncbi:MULTISPECIES: hypothetical protein [Saccharothrix]|uniref:hypothetical protein n=1 Tax=Saccharothrix TaxID=2071 RepID=UPI00093C0806|nr:hypothetical protein [Saccharothrix sp. CB00851]OKI24674.1 hypothetical protein A6A25_34235 [Saccharothrix sp. CB00851]